MHSNSHEMNLQCALKSPNENFHAVKSSKIIQWSNVSKPHRAHWRTQLNIQLVLCPNFSASLHSAIFRQGETKTTKRKLTHIKFSSFANDLVPCRSRLEHHRRSLAALASTEEMMCWPLPRFHYKLSNLQVSYKLEYSNHLKAKTCRQTLWWATQTFDPMFKIIFSNAF